MAVGRVRVIFRSYLKLGSLNHLMTDLRKRRIVTKVRKLKTGVSIGGIPFTRGSLAQLLRNRFYIGEVAFKGEVLKGEQPAMLDRALFDAVQARLNKQVNNHKAKRMKSEALLAGSIFDDRGNRMTPSHARRGNVKYRYYLSSALLQGTAHRRGVPHPPASSIGAPRQDRSQMLERYGTFRFGRSGRLLCCDWKRHDDSSEERGMRRGNKRKVVRRRDEIF